MKTAILRHARHISLLMLLALLALSAAACGGDAPSMQPQSKTPTGPGQPSRTNMRLPPVNAQNGSGGSYGWTLLDSRRMQLKDHLGEVVVLDFWATYCPPCLEEAPHLADLQRRYGRQGLRIIGLNVGGEDDRPKIPEFVRQFRIPYTLGYPDPGTTELYLGDDTRIPQTLVFDRQGKLVKHLVGFDPQVSAELDKAIESALGAPTD